jgi:hypothetical protein
MHPKAKQDDLVRLLTDVGGEFTNRTIPKASVGVVVECYTTPEGYTVDFDLSASNNPDPLALEFESVDLSPEHFEVVPYEERKHFSENRL